MKFTFLKSILPQSFSKYLEKVRNDHVFRLAIRSQEKSPEFVARKNFYKHLMQKNTIYFDIGANYGNRIGPALKLGVKKVVAVEPQKLCCEYLKKAYPRVEILQKGVTKFLWLKGYHHFYAQL